MLGLICLDILPEIIEIGKWYFVIFTLLGFFSLIIIDKIIPHHDHKHQEDDEEEEDHQEHLVHISTITLIALLLHNMLEGMGLYNIASHDLKNGIIMMLGIGLHNIPFGFQIASLNHAKKHILLLTFLVLSGFLGGLIFCMFGTLNPILEGIILSLTLGMLCQILFLELFKEVWQNKHKKETIYGIIIGIVFLILINLI